MGKIRPEVSRDHLVKFPSEAELISPFSLEFDISWAARRAAYRTHFSVYILKPEPEISRLFGLDQEIALFIFDFDPMEARTFQAIDQVILEAPLYGRVDPSIYIILGRSDRTSEWVLQYITRNPSYRTVIPVSFSSAVSIRSTYDLRNAIANTLFRRDLFDERLPVSNNLYFFGRDNILSKLRDQITAGQNTGLFGLRKTGKTSILYKLIRDSKEIGFCRIVYIDCKNPMIRNKSARQLVKYISREISSIFNISMKKFIDIGEYEEFAEIVRLATKSKPICLIFDEIEYISPAAKLDTHWHRDFLDLWQLIWSTQSVYRNLSFIIGGVNAGVCESPVYHGVQNPLFSIVSVEYLRGLDEVSLGRMISYFGSQMGLRFSSDALNILQRHYGGHPLLTRLACSVLHKEFESAGMSRPIAISGADLAQRLNDCDGRISAYCAHVVSELKEFYPDEYQILQMASVGQRSEFMEYGGDADLTRHLLAYGVLRIKPGGSPEISLPVLKSFLSREFARTNETSIPSEIIAKERRESWVMDVSQRITRDLGALLKMLPKQVKSPFGSRGIPDLDVWAGIKLVKSRSDFELFISILYKVLYENVKRHLAEPSLFGTVFKSEWPAFHEEICRVKIYRDYTHHIEVSSATMTKYDSYLERDLGGCDPASVVDGWFALQQTILDGLLYSVQVETASRST